MKVTSRRSCAASASSCARSGPSPTTRKRAPRTSAAARRKRSGFLTSTSRPTKATVTPSPRGGATGAATPLWITCASPNRRSSETTTTSSAARARSRAARERSSCAAPWCVASTGGRRGPRAMRTAAAAITVAFVLCACTTCGRKARTKAACRAVHSATPSGERPRSGRTRRRARRSASSGPAAPETATSCPRSVSPCASASTTRSAPPRAMPGLASRILTSRKLQTARGLPTT